MARILSNVEINTDSWEIAILKLNELLRSHSFEIITANTTYANTGNTTVSKTAQLYGTFGSNTIVVGNTLRGGNVTGLHANLSISSNVNITNATASNVNLLISNNTSLSHINPIGVYIGNNIANSYMNTTSIVVQSNSTVNSSITPSLISISNSSSSANITPISFVTGISTINTSQISVGSNVFANSTTFKIGNTQSSITSNSSVLSIGNTTTKSVLINNTLSLEDSSSHSILDNEKLALNDVFTLTTSANSDVGNNVSTPFMIYRFDKSTFSSGKFQIQVKNANTTQISDVILAHDNINAITTVYGTVSAPASANNISPLGTFSAGINGANVELLFSQTISNSAIKVVAQLMTV